MEEPEKRSFEKEPSFNVVKNTVIQAAIQCRLEIPKEKTDEKFRELALAAMNGDTKAQYRYGKELVRLGQGDEADTCWGLPPHTAIFLLPMSWQPYTTAKTIKKWPPLSLAVPSTSP